MRPRLATSWRFHLDLARTAVKVFGARCCMRAVQGAQCKESRERSRAAMEKIIHLDSPGHGLPPSARRSPSASGASGHLLKIGGPAALRP